MFDLLGRKYVNRPIFYNVLLSRIVRTSAKLISIFNSLSKLQTDRSSYTANEAGLIQVNVKEALGLIDDGFAKLTDINLDCLTLFHRDEKEMDKEYDKLTERISKEIRDLQKAKKKDDKLIKKLTKHLEHLEKEKKIDEEKDEIKEFKEDENKINQSLKDFNEILTSTSKDAAELYEIIHHYAKHGDLASKHTAKDVANPAIAISELSYRNNRRIMIFMKREGIEIRTLHNEISELQNKIADHKGRLNELNKMGKELDLLEKDETKMLKDTGKIEQWDQILIHRLLHSFLHHIHAEAKQSPEIYAPVKDRIEEVHLRAQRIMQKIREQTKKFRNEFY